MSASKKLLETEASKVTELLQGKIVKKIWRHSKKQLGIEFTDGTRLFIDHEPTGVELTIT